MGMPRRSVMAQFLYFQYVKIKALQILKMIQNLYPPCIKKEVTRRSVMTPVLYFQYIKIGELLPVLSIY